MQGTTSANPSTPFKTGKTRWSSKFSKEQVFCPYWTFLSLAHLWDYFFMSTPTFLSTLLPLLISLSSLQPLKPSPATITSVMKLLTTSWTIIPTTLSATPITAKTLSVITMTVTQLGIMESINIMLASRNVIHCPVSKLQGACTLHILWP